MKTIRKIGSESHIKLKRGEFKSSGLDLSIQPKVVDSTINRKILLGKEPVLLKNGKIFQKVVQSDYKVNSIGGDVGIEEHVSFDDLPDIKKRNGRIDIIIQIKATDWDKINQKNIKRNLYKHGKQLFNYIDKFVNVDNKNVGLGVIYPVPPKTEGLKEFIENIAMDMYSFPVYWYSEVKTA